MWKSGCLRKNATAKIILDIEYENQTYSLGFAVSKVSNTDNAYYQTSYIDFSEFQRFSEMILSTQNKNLTNFIAISETRPIANIIAKEPYMFKGQIRDKIAKGKSYEVMRNKIVLHNDSVQQHINNVMQTEHIINEVERDAKTYITIKVDDKDIFSYGSGFLQLAEIFSSLEFIDAKIYILLIDEPDAHLHLKLQKKLIDELRCIEGCQLFIITHNERFLGELSDNEILFLSQSAKKAGMLNPLPDGCKSIVLENLSGCIPHVEKFKYARKLIMVEGEKDVNFIESLQPLYEQFFGFDLNSRVIMKMDGIDTLNAKLISYSRALKDVIPPTCNWLVIRDTDCVPISKKNKAGNDDIKTVDVSGANIEVYFQNGYGIESTFASEPDKLSRMLIAYYDIDISEEEVLNIILGINSEYYQKVKDFTNEEIHKKLKKHFERQKNKRSGKVYKDLIFEDMV